MRLSRTEEREKNRRALLASVRRAVADRGPDVSLDVISEGADVTTGAIYSIFGTKRYLLAAVLAEDIDVAIANLNRIVSDDMTARAVARTMAEVWLAPMDQQNFRGLSGIEAKLAIMQLVDPDDDFDRQITAQTTLVTDTFAKMLEGRPLDVGSSREVTADEAKDLSVQIRALLGGFTEVFGALRAPNETRESAVRGCEALTISLALRNHTLA